MSCQPPRSIVSFTSGASPLIDLPAELQCAIAVALSDVDTDRRHLASLLGACRAAHAAYQDVWCRRFVATTQISFATLPPYAVERAQATDALRAIKEVCFINPSSPALPAPLRERAFIESEDGEIAGYEEDQDGGEDLILHFDNIAFIENEEEIDDEGTGEETTQL